MIQFCINSAQSNMPFMKVTAYASYFPVTASFKLKLNLCKKIGNGNQREISFYASIA